ncbi:unnamed protein product [Adineta ricciae]|uniref:Uncharacterized protein n=1 Tax=Adineta ricciae TaxID=249248 RepID=A0A814FC37_ADIRI|nr:unnamed protein product [Adineta ricciae]CAF1378270.1 unnamed protein product [Adineta ricciae]
MFVSGNIVRYQLACPSFDDLHFRNESFLKIVVQCYRADDSQFPLTKEIFLFGHVKPAVTITCNNVQFRQSAEPILYTCNYNIDNLPPGNYSIFAYEDFSDTHGSLEHPEKQAFGWSTNETGEKWTQHAISNSNADIILRKPHSFFAIGYPTETDTARFYRIDRIPVLQLNASTPSDRGYAHGYLLAPHILDWFYFYLLEENFGSITKYKEFYAYVDPSSKFFHYPTEYLCEIQGILLGMQARIDCKLYLHELKRPFNMIDLLAMNSYIERRTIRSDARTDDPNCSQVVVGNTLTADQRIIAGRNMDGECDIRRVTVSTTLLFAINSSSASKEYRYVSLSWPGMVGVLSGVNETGFYSMENAGPSQIGGQIKGLTPVSYVATHALRTLNARSITKDDMKAAFEKFTPDSTLNNDSKCWPTDKAISELKGPICGPGSIFVFATISDQENSAFVLEGDRYGGCLRTSLQAPPYIPDCILATNHFLRYGFTSSSGEDYRNFESNVSFNSLHRYESIRQQMEALFRLKKSTTYLDVQDIRSLLQSACTGHTEHTIEVELELNGKITLHIHLAALEFGMWYAPYEPAQTIIFEELFQ